MNGRAGRARPAETGFAARCLAPVELIPWWAWAALCLVNAVWGVTGLRSAGDTGELARAVVFLVLVPPSQAVVAWRRRRGLPLWRLRG